ncbi:MAG: hypothetical protein IJJ11_06955 [Methanosphaera sp.]|nr:hypothetical protein [Methanosphaera sp.]
MFSKFIVSNALSDLRNIGEEYYVNENSFEYVKKLSPANVAGMILNMVDLTSIQKLKVSSKE